MTVDTEKEIFLAALQMTGGAEQEGFLNSACLGDGQLRARVNELLSLYSETDRFMARPAGIFPVDGSFHQEKPGDFISHYRLVHALGAGGCGIVYRAEQETPIRRAVALKIIKPGMDTRSIITRFESERQALALMAHPNIAKVLDAGSTTAGRPYFVMELVEGDKITDYCARNRCTLQDRLELVILVCEAVQHAHQKGIIHRDLKPSNVLVTLQDGKPVPKIIDFGIAKATQGKLTDSAVDTALHPFIGTPAYMSPEQAEMSPDIDTRTDIYSIGVLLYELLTGAPPFENRELLSAGFEKMRHIICDVEPKLPSLAKGGPDPISFSTDLDFIVIKCLEKIRWRRYETASDLAQDLRRYLNNEPVGARPAGLSYRFQKFVRRNRLPFAAAAIAVTALVAAVVISSVQMFKARRAEQAATEQAQIARAQTGLAKMEAENAKEMANFLVENLLGVDCCAAVPDADAITFEATQALVQKVARRLDGRFTNQPAMEADFRMALTRALHASRDYKGIAHQAGKAWELRQRLYGPVHSNTLDAVKELAYAQYHSGQRTQAFQVLDKTVQNLKKSSNGLSLAGAAVAGTYGILLAWDGRASNALPYLTEALQANEKADPGGKAVKAWKMKLAEATEWSGNLDRAEELWRDLYRESVATLPKDDPFTIQPLKAYARVLGSKKKWTAALPLLEEVVGISKAKMGNTNYSTLDAEFLLAQAYAENGQEEAATRLYLELYPQLSKHFQYDPAIRYSAYIANFLVRQKMYSRAAEVQRALCEHFEANPPQTAENFERFLIALGATKGWRVAGEICRKSFDRFQNSLQCWATKAWIFRFLGDEENYRRVVLAVLDIPTGETPIKEHYLPIEIAALGSVLFSPAQIAHLDSRIDALRGALPELGENLSESAYRAIALMQLRLGRTPQCLEALSKIPEKAEEPDPFTLFIKAAALHSAKSPEAASLFHRTAGLIEPPETLAHSLPFVAPAQLFRRLVMHRETTALFQQVQPSANP